MESSALFTIEYILNYYSIDIKIVDLHIIIFFFNRNRNILNHNVLPDRKYIV